MKYYEKMVDLGCFTHNDIEQLTGNRKTAHSLIESYKRKGLIDSVKRDLFVAISFETKQPVPNRYAIASHAAPNAYVAYHSALEYHGIANQVYFEVYASSASRFRTFEHNGLTYRHVSIPITNGVDENSNGVRVTDLERTIIDGINDFDKMGGLDELLCAIDMIPFLNGDKLMHYLDSYNKIFLYQKAGYILMNYKSQLKLTDEFFVNCKTKFSSIKRYLHSSFLPNNLVFNKEWALYVPKNLSSITRKGATNIE
ncbi:MAG: transcriptional regulator [Oscillospiraceae bacterium]|nr:transcriptional regulator [Oscillospiraceae bacterium]